MHLEGNICKTASNHGRFSLPPVYCIRCVYERWVTLKTKTRCILSIVLSVLPAFWWTAQQAAGLLSEEHPHAAWVLGDFFGMAVLGENTMWLYILYPILCAIAACVMHRFAQADIPARLEMLLLGFPVAGGIVAILNYFLSAWVIGFEVFAPLTILSAIVLLGWLICNIAALVYLQREKRQDNA